MSLYREKVSLFVKGTCGAAWPRPLYREDHLTSHHDFLIPRKCYFSAEDLGWRYLNPRGSYITVCKRNFPMQADVTVKQKTVEKLL